jgi:hypothetical protein
LNPRGMDGTWPGLAPPNLLRRRSLDDRSDFRDLLGDVLVHDLGPTLATILPGHSYQPVGVLA